MLSLLIASTGSGILVCSKKLHLLVKLFQKVLFQNLVKGFTATKFFFNGQKGAIISQLLLIAWSKLNFVFYSEPQWVEWKLEKYVL